MEKLCTPVEKSNWLISSLRLLSAMYDWEERYTGASVVHNTGSVEASDNTGVDVSVVVR